MKGIYYPYLHHFLESIMMIFNISCFKIYYIWSWTGIYMKF